MLKLQKSLMGHNRSLGRVNDGPYNHWTEQDNSNLHGLRSTSSTTGPVPTESTVCDSRCWLHELSSLNDQRSNRAYKKVEQAQFSTPTGSSQHNPHIVKHNVKNSTFLYRDLRPWQTRLIALNPGRTDDLLSCSLVESEITSGHGFRLAGTSTIVQYEALSYSWGQGARDHSILCNGIMLAIPKALAQALSHMRLPGEKRYIWCDAICINQKDLQEKAVQVGMMFRIFEKAHRVIAWLGTPPANFEKVIQALQLSAEGKRERLGYWSCHHKRCSTTAMDIRIALSELMRCQWFLRTWVRQEVYAARELILQIGYQQLSFNEFFERASLLDKTLHTVNSNQPLLVIPHTSRVFSREYQHSGADRTTFSKFEGLPTYTSYWLDTLLAGSRFQVTDERDRVYATLGVLMNRNARFFSQAPADVASMAEKFPVDYRKTTAEVYHDAIKFLINETQSLEVIEHFDSSTRRIRSELHSLSNWGIDWGYTRTSVGLCPPLNRQRDGFVKVLDQDYARPGQLCLQGTIMATELSMLDQRKSASRPHDSRNPDHRKAISLSDLLQEPQPRTPAQKLRLSSKPDHPQYAFVFTKTDESKTTFELRHEIPPSTKFQSDFATHLASQGFIVASAKRHLTEDFAGLEGLHLVVPPTAAPTDMLVSLYGSSCMHLVRPQSQNSHHEVKCQYISPVAAVVLGQDPIAHYATPHRGGSRSFPKSAGNGSPFQRTTFILT